MSQVTVVDKLYQEAKAVLDMLATTAEVSLRIVAEDNLRKSLLLAASSYFERRVCESVLDFVKSRSGGSRLVTSFVNNKAIARQYHTWFKWDENNANQFYGLFGPEFRASMLARIKESEFLREAVRAFLELGNERNKLVHQDYATFYLEKTLDEIYVRFKLALAFVDLLPRALMECDTSLEKASQVSETLLGVDSADGG